LFISKISDISKPNPQIKFIYVKKFLSSKLANKIVSFYKNLEKIYISNSAYKRANKKVLEILKKRGISIFIVKRKSGRPNLLEKNLDLVSERLTLDFYSEIPNNIYIRLRE